MDHYYECDGIQYRLSLVVPLNQTLRSTEPSFEFQCNEWPLWAKIATGAFFGIIIASTCLVCLCKYLSRRRRRKRIQKAAAIFQERARHDLEDPESKVSLTSKAENSTTGPIVDTMEGAVTREPFPSAE